MICVECDLSVIEGDTHTTWWVSDCWLGRQSGEFRGYILLLYIVNRSELFIDIVIMGDFVRVIEMEWIWY